MFQNHQVDLWTETLKAKEYDALATMIANGVATEIEVTTEQQLQLERAGHPSGGGRERGASGAQTGAESGGKMLVVTRYNRT